jgi:hypothetical protein
VLLQRDRGLVLLEPGSDWREEKELETRRKRRRRGNDEKKT